MQYGARTILGTLFVLLLVLSREHSEASTPKSRFWAKLFRRNKTSTKDTNMGQAMRIVKYDRAENERNAIPALTLLSSSAGQDGTPPLRWHRLDDGVMGGQSETLHQSLGDDGLDFCGEINTNGGGFCSIRSPLEGLPEGTTALKIRVKGDGKTYKMLLSDGSRSTFGPSRRSPSWQHDVPTTPNQEQELVLPLADFLPSFGPAAPPPQESRPPPPGAASVRELGFMLSLKLSDGGSNPPETFGSGIFPFSLKVLSIEPVVGSPKTTESSL